MQAGPRPGGVPPAPAGGLLRRRRHPRRGARRRGRRRLAEREGSYMEEAWTGRDEDLRDVAAARETGGYGRLSLDLVDALHGDGSRGHDPQRRQSLEPARSSTRPPSSRCPASSAGAGSCRSRSAASRWPPQARIVAVRAAERAAIEAALSGSRSLAVQALALHPLVPSVEIASRILDRHLAEQPGLAETLR